MKTVKSTKAGLKIFIDKKHVKTISNKFEPIIDGFEFDLRFKRVSELEKIELTNLLKKHNDNIKFSELLSIYLEDLKYVEKYVYELIQNASFKACRKVSANITDNRHEIGFYNNVWLKCSERMYRLSPTKEKEKFLNY